MIATERAEDDGLARILVMDSGKTNIKLVACSAGGQVIETLSTPNPVRPGPPWDHHDLGAINDWLLQGMAALCARHPIGHVIATGHGSSGILTYEDPDQDGIGVVLPMVDYEQKLPEAVVAGYGKLAGSFADRGSAVMPGATHVARQVYWAETSQPQAFAKTRWILGLPQFWAWRLSGVAASEASFLGAQSQLWNVVAQDWAQIVKTRGWGKLLPPLRKAAEDLGPIRPELAKAYGLPPGLRIHTGGHDSSVSFSRYQAAGLKDFMVLSTGTWIVALADQIPLARLDEHRGMTLNADVTGAPTGGALVMGGREYAAIAGAQTPEPRADLARIRQLIAQGSMVLPAFGLDGGQFPHRLGQGQIIGPAPETAEDRHALAVLYVALLAHHCGSALAPERLWVLDGTFLKDPAFAALIATLRPEAPVLINRETYGIAAGAALLCRKDQTEAPLDLRPAMPIPDFPDLRPYAAQWRAISEGHLNR